MCVVCVECVVCVYCVCVCMFVCLYVCVSVVTHLPMTSQLCIDHTTPYDPKVREVAVH